MILDKILNILSILFNILLAPLEVINIGIDIVSSIPIFTSFLQISVYLLPFNNLYPLLIIVGAIISFKIVISTLKTLWGILPFF